MKKIVTLFMLMVILVTVPSSCKKDKGNPPSLPPEESMSIDFDNFNSGKSGGVQLQKGVEDSNWTFAALVAGYFKSLIVSTLAVPVASFGYALDQKPTYIENKTWQWSFNVTALSLTYKARLTGQIRTSDVLWKMYISKEGTGAFSEFVWFEGTSKLDGTGGQWTLNHSSQFQEPVLQIDWTASGTSVTTVKYTYVRTLNNNRVADTFKNSYILYGKTTGTYNAYYTIHYYNGLAFSDVDVEWNSTSKIGHVKCQAYFSDTSWHCWNALYINTVCP
jgi:hypothetical protein